MCDVKVEIFYCDKNYSFNTICISLLIPFILPCQTCHPLYTHSYARAKVIVKFINNSMYKFPYIIVSISHVNFVNSPCGNSETGMETGTIHTVPETRRQWLCPTGPVISFQTTVKLCKELIKGKTRTVTTGFQVNSKHGVIGIQLMLCPFFPRL